MSTHRKRPSLARSLTAASLAAGGAAAAMIADPVPASPLTLLAGESVARLASTGAPALSGAPVGPQSDPAEVRGLQSRLASTGLAVEATGTWDAATTAAVKRFQAKQGLPRASGTADAKTVARLVAVARDGVLDPRCLGPGITICVDKAQKLTRYVRDGQVIEQMDGNFGPERGDPKFGQYSRTREGVFRIFVKTENSISTLYGTPLPYYMAFSGGEGFHYSKYFDQADYQDTSMGCVTSNDRAKSAWFFENTPLKTKVVVYS